MGAGLLGQYTRLLGAICVCPPCARVSRMVSRHPSVYTAVHGTRPTNVVAFVCGYPSRAAALVATPDSVVLAYSGIPSTRAAVQATTTVHLDLHPHSSGCIEHAATESLL